jgi:hypothetical protein
MHDIEMQKASEEFSRCWHAAGRHLQTLAQGAPLSWLKVNLTPPILEHLSFRVGNQLFFIRIEDVDGQIDIPGNPIGVLSVAAGCEGYACLMPMRRMGSDWVPTENGWGLIDAKMNTPIDPAALVTDEEIEMTDWELHDFAVQVVRDHIVKDLGHQLMSSQGNPGVDPSIWFVGDHGPEWVVVRAVTYPDLDASLPTNIGEISEYCARLSRIGHFASVAVANSDDDFESSGKAPVLPIWRGHELFFRFEGLGPVSVH